jgi:aminodeoxychorismate lyase
MRPVAGQISAFDRHGISNHHQAMVCFLNGQFVSEDKAVVSVFDRGFLYGDGLFETLRLCSGKPFRWQQHWERLQRGADFLQIPLPFPAEELGRCAAQLVERNQMPDSILRVTLSRGAGPRGYSPKGAGRPTLVMNLHPAPGIDLANPPQWRLITSKFQLPVGDPLSQHKTSNKLGHVLARAEAEAAGADEALMVSSEGEVAEGASANIFWIDQNAVCTPPLACGVLPGVTRATVLELCAGLGLPSWEAVTLPEELHQMEGVFLTLTGWGIVEAAALDRRALGRSPLVAKIRAAYEELVRAECGGRRQPAV